ncbi:MAG: N-acetyl-gamma-glutamyl-phosphate reductase [Oscillospiraceae bacterium]|nr:N-acetyl-gamma-glutamyl-phosphate reductase [Oscillospiraceae bacterium]
MKRVFIDGSSGTTGLRIHQRLEGRQDIALVELPGELRKNPAAKREMLNDGCDVAILCLPDEAAVEAVNMVENPAVTVLDASTAHRTDERFVYGFPELGEKFRAGIQSSRRVANPGCHASGFIALVYPLVEAGLVDRDVRLVCHSLTGYSGGGKKMIDQYQAPGRDSLLDAPRQYGLNQRHKHLREMMAVPGLTAAPIFCPIVGDFYSGMEVTVALFAEDLRGTEADLRAVYQEKYKGPVVAYRPEAEEGGFLSAGAFSGMDGMEISVHGNSERLLLTARFDNLGKGASGAAVQNLNLILGAEETTGLSL